MYRGNNNYVVSINGVAVSFASVLREIINQTDSENRTLILVLCSICALMTILLILIIIHVLLLAEYRRTKSHIVMSNIESGVAYLERRIENITCQTDRLFTGSVRMRTNGRTENVCTDTYPESSV